MRKFDKLTGVAAPMPMSNIDTDKIIPQLGIRYQVGKVDVHATAGNVFYLSRTTAPRAVDPPGAKNRNPDMAGDYATSVTYLLLGVGVHM